MFNTLVETNGNKQETGRQAGYLSVTAVAYAILFFAVFVWSLYSINLNFGEEDTIIATLVAPAAMPENAPQPPEPDKPDNPPKTSDKPQQNYDERTHIVQNMAEAPITNKEKTVEGVESRRAGVPVKIGDVNSNAKASDGIESPAGNGGATSGAYAPTVPKQVDETEIAPEAPKIQPTPAPTPKASLKPVSKGVINSIAKFLPKPAYPATAKAMGASGEVKVQVTIDESGNVISAAVVSGHQLLRAPALNAARQAKFTPTKLSEEPVKVTGIIVYNFVAP